MTQALSRHTTDSDMVYLVSIVYAIAPMKLFPRVRFQRLQV